MVRGLARDDLRPLGFALLLVVGADELPRDRLRGVGVAFGHELARAAGVRPTKRTAQGLERVCAALRSLGYQATLEQADGNEAVIATPNCPLRPLVVAQPDAALIDEGMWAGLAEATLAGHRADAIACEARGCLDAHASCRIHLHLQSRR